MKISKSKQELARIISENGGWRDGAEFAAQDKGGKVFFYGIKPTPHPRVDGWSFNGVMDGYWVACGNELPNWHQTILSREEYFHLYPAPDADGWIEWNGGECPVDENCIVSYKMKNAETFKRGEPASEVRWTHNGAATDIIAYRLHKPEQAKPEFCESVMRSIPGLGINSKNIDINQVDDINVVESKPTIEQLAADYRNAKDYAERKQQEADDAKADAVSKLKALKLAGKEHGLLVSPIAAKQGPELVINDWRDLRVGDEIEVFNFECQESESRRKQELMSGPCVVMQVESGNVCIELKKNLPTKGSHWNAPGIDACDFKFIRRP